MEASSHRPAAGTSSHGTAQPFSAAPDWHSDADLDLRKTTIAHIVSALRQGRGPGSKIDFCAWVRNRTGSHVRCRESQRLSQLSLPQSKLQGLAALGVAACFGKQHCRGSARDALPILDGWLASAFLCFVLIAISIFSTPDRAPGPASLRTTHFTHRPPTGRACSSRFSEKRGRARAKRVSIA